LRFSRQWLWRMSSSGMWRRVDLVWTDVSEEGITSIFRVQKSASEEPAWAGGCRGRFTPEKSSPVTHWTGGWLGHELVWTTWRKFLTVPRLELWPLGCPAYVITIEWLWIFPSTRTLQYNAVLSVANKNKLPQGPTRYITGKHYTTEREIFQECTNFSCNGILCNGIVITDISPLTQTAVKPRQWDTSNWLRNTDLHMCFSS
jgi:hypothetical protein